MLACVPRIPASGRVRWMRRDSVGDRREDKTYRVTAARPEITADLSHIVYAFWINGCVLPDEQVVGTAGHNVAKRKILMKPIRPLQLLLSKITTRFVNKKCFLLIAQQNSWQVHRRAVNSHLHSQHSVGGADRLKLPQPLMLR